MLLLPALENQHADAPPLVRVPSLFSRSIYVYDAHANAFTLTKPDTQIHIRRVAQLIWIATLAAARRKISTRS